MAIPGTPEYHREWMARREAERAAAAAAPVPQIDPASVGLDVQMAAPMAAPVRLEAGGIPTGSLDGPIIAPVRGAPPAEAPAGPDSGTVIRKGGGIRDAALASMRDRGMPTPVQAQQQLTGGQTLAGAEGVAADAYEQAGLGLLGTAGAQVVRSVANPEYKITRDYVKTSREITDRQRAAQEQIDAAEVKRAADVADELDYQNGRQQAALVDMQSRQFAQEQQAIEAQERSRKAYDLVAQATDRLASTPDVDPNRAWADKTAGQRFAARLTMVGRGMLGHDPQGALNAEIERDIEAQKATFAQRSAVVGARQGQLDAARSLYADIRAQTQDEREADEIMRIARLEQAKVAFESLAARSAIPSVKAAQQQFLIGLDQQIADRRLQLGRIAVHNVRRKAVVGPAYRTMQLPDGTVVRVPVGGAADQQRATYLLEQADKSRGDARKVLGEEVAGAQRIEGDVARERAKVAAEAQAQAATGSPENRRMIAKETAVPNRVRSLAGDLIKMIEERGGDVPGEGWYVPGLGTAKHELTAEARRFRKLRDELSQYDIVDLTGAVSSEQQDRIIQDLASGSEEEVLRGLRDIQHAMDTYVNTIEAADPAAARAIREHTRKGLEGWRGGNVAGASSVVSEDQ